MQCAVLQGLLHALQLCAWQCACQRACVSPANCIAVQAEIVREWVGLRPGRPSVRLETELQRTGSPGGQLRIVHNYGHGGAGLTLHWGCAAEAVRLVQQLLLHDRAQAKL